MRKKRKQSKKCNCDNTKQQNHILLGDIIYNEHRKRHTK